MKRCKLLFGLITDDNDAQLDQAEEARLTARQLGLDIKVVFARGDAIVQSQQILDAVQAREGERPDGVIFDPVSETGLPQVARAAVEAGVAWCTIDLRPKYLADLRKLGSAAVFGVGCDQVEVGRIQGRQLAKLLPRGGTALGIQGPSDNLTAQQRTQGLEEVKPANAALRWLKGKWSKESGYQAMKRYLGFPNVYAADTHCLVCQSDMMAAGAVRAFEEVSDNTERQKWLKMPILGADGLSKTGQAWVDSKLLAATVIVPSTAGLAIKMMAAALSGRESPPEYFLTAPQSFPEIELLEARKHSSAR